MADLISEPGEYQMDPEAYQADPVAGGSLRASVAWLLATRTPAHARYALDNPPKTTKPLTIGSAAHSLILGKGKEIVVVPGTNYSKNEKVGDAPEITKTVKCKMRDDAREKGLIPLLIPEYEQVLKMVAAVQGQMADLLEAGSIPHIPFTDETTERVIVWREDNGVMCRASLDGFSLDGDVLSELKTEGESAAPEKFMWKARRFGYMFKVCFYMRGLSKLGLAHSPSANFFVAETEPPHLLAFHRLDDEMAMKESERVTAAIRLWAQCKRTGRWPGYSVQGYDLTLTERERMAEQMQSGNGHVSSDDIAATL